MAGNPMRVPALCVVVILASLYAGTEAVPLPLEGGVGDSIQLNAEAEGYVFNPNFDTESEVSDIGEHEEEEEEASARAAKAALQGAEALSAVGGNANIVAVPTKKEKLENEGFGKPVGALDKQAAANAKHYAKQEATSSGAAEAAVGKRFKGFVSGKAASKDVEKAAQYKELKMKKEIKVVEKQDAIAQKSYTKKEEVNAQVGSEKLEAEALSIAKDEVTEEKVAEKRADAAVNPALVKRAEAEEKELAPVGEMTAQARAEKLAGVGVLHHMEVSAREEAANSAMKDGKAQAVAIEAAVAQQLPKPTLGLVSHPDPKVNPFSIIPPLSSQELIQIPDGVVPDSAKKEKKPASPNSAPKKKGVLKKKNVAPKVQKATVKPAATKDSGSATKAAAEEAKLDTEAAAADNTGKSKPAHQFGAAELAAQASANKEAVVEGGQAAQQQKAQAQDEAFAAAADAKAKADEVKAVRKADPVHKADVAAKHTAKKEYSEAAQEAMKSATTAALLADQRQVKRDTRFLPVLSKRLHSLEKELASVQKRNKYATNVASAISKGIESVIEGKELPSEPKQSEVLIQLGEGNNPFAKVSDGQVAVQAQMDATAYNQAVAYQNDRNRAELNAEQQIRSGTMSVQQQQAAGIALQAAQAQDKQRTTLMQEIAQVHQNYQHDLAEAQEQAKAKAMATLKNFASNLQSQHTGGGQYHVQQAYENAKAIAPQMAPAFQTSLGEANAPAAKQAPVANKAPAGKKPVAKKAPAAQKPPAAKKAPVAAPKPPVPKKTAPAKKPAAKATMKKVAAKPAAVSEQKQMETKEAKMQAAMIAQAGVERALVDTGKKINAIKKQMGSELKREKKYFQNKQKKAFMSDKKSVATHMNKLKHMKNVAEKNLVEETKRLHEQLADKKMAIARMQKIRKAAQEERRGIEKTSVQAQEMEKAAIAIKSDLNDQLRNYKRPADRVDHVSDTGKVTTVSGERDLGEDDDIQLTADVTMGSLSPSADKIEKKDEEVTNDDLHQIKVLEQTAVHSADIFAHSAKVTEKESMLAEVRQSKIADEAKHVIEKLKADIGEGKAQEGQAKVAEAQATNKLNQVKQTAKQADEEAKAPKGYELGESDQPDELGESASTFAQAQPVGLSKLKAEQFALVNAQTKLNQLTKFRKSKEDTLAKKWGHLEKKRDAQEQVKLQNEMSTYQQNADKEIAQTTSIDKFMVKEKFVAKKEAKDMKKMKQQEDAAVHDEFIATQQSQQAISQFSKLTKVAMGLTSTLHTPALRKVIGQADGVKPSKVQDMKNDMAHFVATHRSSVPKVNEAEIQPTAAKAQEAKVQEKKDEKIAAAYGKRMEHQIEAKMAKPADIRGDGAHTEPQLVDASHNPQP